MNQHKNELGQPIGFPLENWQGCSPPQRRPMQGRYCRLEPLITEQHAQDLYKAYTQDESGAIWTYLPYGPFNNLDEYEWWVAAQVESRDPLFFAIIDENTNKAQGIASYLRIQPPMGVIEVGHINYAPQLQRTTAATEAMYLMMRHVFEDLGYRRYEWKCDTINAGSQWAATRLGFTFEGIFRQAVVYKGRNRDTAWFSILDNEWPVLKQAFEHWLDDDNFTSSGEQRQGLTDMIDLLLGRGQA